ncbi:MULTISPECIES: BadF/BadG/BcrA/BcrD ATPase family protein [unclassified Leifsonia]|uniref:N-acetylglucosamine kinase n=1 Tax=unclassified Leifsonia TaxID=2663824 RepID=UPI001FCDDFE6|nr:MULTISPECIES: BadF/BadG/BcrA/BcrD ATPase family protein [unclassified Leifsonia]
MRSTHTGIQPALVVAIDGGNSKTEVVVLAEAGGELTERARAIGPGSGAGPEAVASAVSAVLRETGTDPASVGSVSAAVAGLDFPGDEAGYRAALSELFPRAVVDVVGDAVAVLEAAAGLDEALAIVCGAGLNAVARGPKGLATVPALGWLSGDSGGGDELGRAAVRAAARAEDGRGPSTLLLGRVLAETVASDTAELGRAIRDGAVSMRQVGALAATVARTAADGDPVAMELLADSAREALLLADVVVRRSWDGSSVPEGTPAILAGGLFADPGFRDSVSAGLRERGFEPRPLEFPPVDGLVRALRERASASRTHHPGTGHASTDHPSTDHAVTDHRQEGDSR